ncbi:hypothetical protein PV327_011713, partial [Microctonus hyperodae]
APTFSVEVAPYSIDSKRENYTTQSRVDGSIKAKGAGYIPINGLKIGRKRKASNDEEIIYSDNNNETDSSSEYSDDNFDIELNNPIITNNVTVTKQPPIVVSLTDKLTFLNIKTKINEIKLNVNYKCNGKFLAITPLNNEAHTKITEVLKNLKAEFHSYARKSEIKPKIILKGLPVLPIEVISNELQGININVTNIYMLRSKTNNNPNLATYLITVENTSILKEIIK